MIKEWRLGPFHYCAVGAVSFFSIGRVILFRRVGSIWTIKPVSLPTEDTHHG